MLIHEVQEQLATATAPIAKIIWKSASSKTVLLGLKSGITLKEHQTNVPAKLIVLDGHVIYREGLDGISLKKFDEHDIPVNVLHSVEGLEDSLCFLIHG